MNEHSKPQPATVGTSPVPSIDLLAGHPRVPITVRRTARTDQDASRRIPARLASRMIAAHSYPGEAVVDLTDGHALTEVAVAGGRVHHKAGLSDVATPTAVIAAETGTGPSRSSERSRYAPRLATAWPWTARRSSRTPRYERPVPPPCRPSDTVEGQAAVYSRLHGTGGEPRWCWCWPGTSPSHLAAPERLGWGFLSDER